MATSTNQNIPRDAFLYLLSIITLIISAVSLGTVVFQYINVYIPDIISDPYLTQSSYLGTMRYALATLVIVFPVFVCLWLVKNPNLASVWMCLNFFFFYLKLFNNFFFERFLFSHKDFFSFLKLNLSK